MLGERGLSSLAVTRPLGWERLPRGILLYFKTPCFYTKVKEGRGSRRQRMFSPWLFLLPQSFSSHSNPEGGKVGQAPSHETTQKRRNEVENCTRSPNLVPEHCTYGH